MLSAYTGSRFSLFRAWENRVRGFADAKHVARATKAALERGDAGLDFDDGVTDGFEAEAAVGLSKDFPFDDAGVVTSNDELHLVAGGLMV